VPAKLLDTCAIQGCMPRLGAYSRDGLAVIAKHVCGVLPKAFAPQLHRSALSGTGMTLRAFAWPARPPR
jgi:hypothetical protein